MVIPRRWKDLGEYLLTTDTIFEQENLCARMAVLGLGAIGLELGQALKRMGLAVTGVDQLSQIGGLQDPEVNRTAVEIFKEEMPLYLGAQADIERDDRGLRVTAGDRDFLTDKTLLSIGRAPNTVRKIEIEQLNDEIAFFTEPAFLMHERPIQSPSVRNTSSTLLSFYFNDVYDDGVTGKTSCQTGRRR